MQQSLTETIQRNRVKTAIRSLAASEHNDQQISHKTSAVKEILGNTTGISVDKHCVAQLSHQYYDMKARYSGKRVVTTVVESAKRDAFWLRVQQRCQAAGVPPERFMKAQFDYFHAAFGTIPKLNQLITEAATTRAQAFAGKTAGHVVSNAIEAPVSMGALFARCEQQVRDVCRAQKMTREEYYAAFVVTKIIAMPQQFLDADPVYKKVLNGL